MPEELLGYEYMTAADKQELDEPKKRICGYLVHCLLRVTAKQVFEANPIIFGHLRSERLQQG